MYLLRNLRKVRMSRDPVCYLQFAAVSYSSAHLAWCRIVIVTLLDTDSLILFLTIKRARFLNIVKVVKLRLLRVVPQ